MNMYKSKIVIFLSLMAFVAMVTELYAVEFIFVRPLAKEGVASVQSLRQAQVVNVRGGRAFAMEEVAPGADSRTDLVRELVQSSRAIAAVASYWDEARKVAPEASQKWISRNCPIPIWVMPDEAPPRGPGLVALVPLKVTRLNGEACECAQLLQINDLGIPGGSKVSITDMVKAKVMTPMVCHECFHGIHQDLYRQRFLLLDLLGSPSGAHDSPDETDGFMALKEGFAEAGELILGEQFPDEIYGEADTELAHEVLAFADKTKKRRISLAKRNRYVFSEDGRIRNGELDEGQKDMATEGVVASLIYTIFGHANLAEPLDKIFRTMASHSPLSFFEFVEKLIKDNEVHSKTLQRIILEYTYYTVNSEKAQELYRNYYLAKKQYVQKKLDKEAYHRVREIWQQWKNEQFERIRAGAPFGAALPQPLLIETKEGYGADLNDKDVDSLAWCLESFMGEKANPDEARRKAELYAARIAKRREELGFITSLEELTDILPNWLVETFQAGRNRALRKIESRLDETVTKRRTLAGY